MKDDWGSGYQRIYSPPIILLEPAIPRVRHIKLGGFEDFLIRIIRFDVILTGVMPRLIQRRNVDLPKLDVTVAVKMHIALLERVLRGTV